MSAARRTSLTLVLGVATTGCILFVDRADVGESCRFAGADSACGSCLGERCQVEIDRACGDEAALSIVEQCADKSDESCDRAGASAPAICMKTKCAPVCHRKVGTSETHCTDSFVSPGLACACGYGSGPPTDLACNPTFYPRTRCCAPLGWPGPALECRCDAISCRPTRDGCSCVLGENVDLSHAPACERPGIEGHCCAIGDACQCGRRACSGEEREVPVCTLAELACPTGTIEASSGCSVRR